MKTLFRVFMIAALSVSAVTLTGCACGGEKKMEHHMGGK